MRPKEIAAALRDAVDAATPRLLAISDDVSARRPDAEKWCPREIIGHLIDSACNNHGRFVRAQLTDDLVFPGYAQDDWVRLQHYHERSWPTLIALWAAYNHHIADVIGAVPDEVANRERHRHNLHEIAWTTVPPDVPTTLAFFMDDYVGHLHHHLRQIWALDGT